MRSMLHPFALALLTLAACQGNVDSPSGPGTYGIGGNNPDSDNGNADCAASGTCTVKPAAPTRAPIRRLTRFEYNNSVRDLFGDETEPATMLPTEPIGNGFGNDADALSVSSLLAEQYGIVAEGVASRATSSPEALQKLHACTANLSADTESACTRSIVGELAPRMYRRPLHDGEADELVALFSDLRGGEGSDFATALSGVIQALLQSPDFLYRPEFGEPDADNPQLIRPTGYEMAARLSYLFWGTLPDDALTSAAASGELSTDDGVLAHATRLLDDPRSHRVLRLFFDGLLPINGLADLTRDATLYPAYSHQLGADMREETQRFLEYEIFENKGSWPSALTAPYTFVNEALAKFYGIDGVTGSEFQKVMWPHPEQRLGLLLQAGVMAGTITTNTSNPVLRGSFMVNKIMCRHITLPTDPKILAQVKVPVETAAPTARERFSQHSTQAICKGCHKQLDPVGFSLENFDAIGQWRERENNVLIDASGSVPGTTGAVNGPVELVKKIAETEATELCFASHWMDFAYGRSMGREETNTQTSVNATFKQSGYNVKQLLLALAQSDAFLHLPTISSAEASP